jgi:hypothetical protein
MSERLPSIREWMLYPALKGYSRHCMKKSGSGSYTPLGREPRRLQPVGQLPHSLNSSC